MKSLAPVLVLLLASSLVGQTTLMVTKGRTDGGSGISGLTPHLRVDSFTADGTWTAPAGVTSALVELWAPGGTGVNNTGAGGGGEYCRSQVAVTPTTGYAIVVGNAASENSTFDTTTVVAVAGASGATSAGGTGGTGDTCFAGGNGASGTGNRAGGGGGGTTEAGSAGAADVAGSGGFHFGGRGTSSAAGQYAFGGGGRSQTASNTVGANGHARVTYSIEVGAGFPVITARSQGSTTANTTSHAVNLPTCASGDLLLAIFGTAAAPTLSGYTGWTSIGEDDETSAKMLVLYKTSTGSDTLTITSSAGSASSHFSACVFGATAAPSATMASASSTNIDPPSHTNAGGSTKALWVVAGTMDNNAQTTTGLDISVPPTNYLGFLFMNGKGSTAAFLEPGPLAMANRHLEIDTENPGAFTSSNEQWVATTIVVPGAP